MPIINNAIIYSDDLQNKIAEVKKEQNYSHKRWADDDLESVRCEIRDYYRTEQRLTCVYCLEPVSSRSAANASVEHILPKSSYLQFMFEPKNLCVVCADCNEFKRNREALVDPPVTGNPIRTYPEKTDRYRIYHPHFDEYKDHIIKVKFLYLEKSKKGGYTIYVCNLNRFIQEFGVSEDFMNSLETIAEQERFHRS